MIKLMDSSLRDGGNVNNWEFGKKTISGIIKNLIEAKIDIIELGYLRDVQYSENITLYNTVSEAIHNVPLDKGNSEFSLMVQEDKWDWSKLEDCTGEIKHIRVSFHKTDIEEGLNLCLLVKAKGYICHCNPINIMGYNDAELLELIGRINGVSPEYFTIVDTFGSMKIDDLKRIDALLQNNLKSEIKIATHLHENLGLAYSLAQEFIGYFENKRDLFVDSSLLGIGRVPGNLCQELMVAYMINEKRATYEINPIYDAIDDFVAKIKKKHPWGYALPYALSATYNLHRTYAEYLVEKGKLKTRDICAILNSIIPSERVIFNQKYIEDLYKKYVDVDADDANDISALKKLLPSKVLILAPGRTIKKERSRVENFINNNNCFTISVNFDGDYVKPDLYFYTNPKRYSYDSENLNPEQIIATSNMLRESVNAKYVINYARFIKHNGKQSIDSVLMLIKLLKTAEVKDIYIAGFDGFTEKEMHYDSMLDNDYMDSYEYDTVKNILDWYAGDIQIKYITSSAYDNEGVNS